MPSLYRLLLGGKYPSGQYSEIDAVHIRATIDRLEKRIEERFPESGLLGVCREFGRVAHDASDLAGSLAGPLWPVRVVSWLAGALLVVVFAGLLSALVQRFSLGVNGAAEVIQTAEAAINELIFLGLALFFLINLESRMKRRVALKSIHRLRSIAHVVDMHQLTKDPARLLASHVETQSSPGRILTQYELTRYLDYCSELLALTSKISALFAQYMDDPVVLTAVNDVDTLTQGLSAKIWQKIMILDLAIELKD